MNNNSLGGPFQFGSNQQFTDFSKVESAAEASERKAAERAAQRNESKKAENANDNAFVKDFARLLGGDIAATLANPLLGSAKTNFDLGKFLIGSLLTSSLPNKDDTQKTSREYTDEEKKKALDWVEDQTRKATERLHPTSNKTEDTTTEDEGEYVEYTYKPGDTFGQVVMDLGLESGNGLWGDSGDVNFYTQQLIDQGALDSNGNIPIGTTIRLKKRPLTQEMMDYRNQYGY